ncbi:MAG: hypothetical protein QY325_04065 [Flavobacteriales bacterium]|jgi:hypothetical protein|nr:MAG: hypothetical protein QY325_04065 [Flavobacteriales bacterium]
MTTRITIGLLALALPLCAIGQQASAEEYFNRASREYVKVDKSPAMRILDQGLRAHPGDPRLLKLAEELLKQDRQNRAAQAQQEQPQESSGQEEKESADQGTPKPEESGKEGESQGETGDGRRESRSGLNRQDAERMLDAVDRKEQDVQQQVRAKTRPAHRASIEKDW